MRKLTLVSLFVVVPSSLIHAQAANPLTVGARLHYGIIKGNVVRAAAKMPEAQYPFRPAPEVRSFAQLIGHLADANYRLCSVMAGQDPPIDAGNGANTPKPISSRRSTSRSSIATSSMRP